jgi:anti-anti-sigma regulatory factor
MRSNVERRMDEIRLLEEHGHRIHVFELEGFLFFGTTDKLADEIEQVLSQEGDYVILDFRRVSDIDSTGAKMLVQLHNRIRKLGKTLILSSVNTAELANELGILTSIGQDRCFASIDEALGWAEDRLLDGLLGAERYCRKLDLTHVDALRHFSANDFKILLSYCQEVACDDGEILFYQDDPSEDVYIIVQGRANLFLSGGDEKGLERRLATLCPGTFCGEMAILDNRPRSATVVAEGTLICHKLSVAKLHELYEAHPEVAYNLLKGLGQELAKRIRIANRLNTELRT